MKQKGPVYQTGPETKLNKLRMDTTKSQVLQDLERKRQETEQLCEVLWHQFKQVEEEEAEAVKRINEARARWNKVYLQLEQFDSFRAMLEKE